MKPSGPLPWRLWIALLWARVPLEDGTIRKGHLGWESLCDDREFRLSIWGALRGPSMGVVKNGAMAGIPCHHPVFDNVLGFMPAIYCHHPVLSNTWRLRTAITRFFATRGRTGLSSPELTQPARVRGRHHLAQTRWPRNSAVTGQGGQKDCPFAYFSWGWAWPYDRPVEMCASRRSIRVLLGVRFTSIKPQVGKPQRFEVLAKLRIAYLLTTKTRMAGVSCHPGLYATIENLLRAARCHRPTSRGRRATCPRPGPSWRRPCRRLSLRRCPPEGRAWCR